MNVPTLREADWVLQESDGGWDIVWKKERSKTRYLSLSLEIRFADGPCSEGEFPGMPNK